MVLGYGTHTVSFPQGQRLHQSQRAQLGEMGREIAPRRARRDAMRDLVQDRTGVHAGVELDDGDARRLEAFQDRPLDGRGAAQLGQERRVNVDQAALGQRQQLGPQDVTVSHDDADIRRDLLEATQERRIGRRLRLEELDLFRLRGHFHGGGDECGARPALGAVGTGDDGAHVESLSHQRPQRGHRKLGRAEEHDDHYSSPAGSGVTSLRKPVFPLRRRFHLESSRPRFTAER